MSKEEMLVRALLSTSLLYQLLLVFFIGMLIAAMTVIVIMPFYRHWRKKHALKDH